MSRATKWRVRRSPFGSTLTASTALPQHNSFPWPSGWLAWRIDERGWEISAWSLTWEQAMRHADLNPPKAAVTP